MCRRPLASIVLLVPLACATPNPRSNELGDTQPSDLTSDTTSSTETSTGDPGDSLGIFDLTYYWVTYEGDFDPPANTDIGTCDGQTIATVPAAYASALGLEGSGKLLDERIVNIGGCGCGGGYDCFAVLDPLQFPWGQGSQGNALVPYLSIATDTAVLPFGTSLYAPELDGLPLPEGGTHDGCLRAADVGGGINGMHFDWFVGLKRNYQTLDAEVPEQVELFAGGARCP
jgi:3D (Asp-Asp-Asp) domain-containing protein